MTTPHDYLIGGTITGIEEAPHEGGHGTMTSLEVTFPRSRAVNTFGYIGVAKSVKLQIWQDEEGNGPGALVLVEAKELVET